MAAQADRSALLPDLRALLLGDDGAAASYNNDGVAADDQTLLRFLRARKGDVAAAGEQYRATCAWRREVDAAQYRRGYPAAPDPTSVDAVPDALTAEEAIADLQATAAASAAAAAALPLPLRCDGVEIYPTLRLTARDDLEWAFRTHCAHANFGFDREGRPVYIERTGLTARALKKMLKSVSKEQVVTRHIRQQELAFARMQESSARCGRPVTTQTLVYDMAGLSLWPDPAGLALFKDVMHIDATFYPECLGKHFIINAPFIFSAIWRLVRSWLDPVTAGKIVILGSNYREKLLEVIAPEQLPAEYGGTNSFVLERPRNEPEAGRGFMAVFDAARVAVLKATGCAVAVAAAAAASGAGAGAAGGGASAAAPPDPPAASS
jgi:hypothetical protein